MTPEGKIKAQVDKALKTLPNVWAFKPVLNGMGKPALDYVNCISGKFVAIETKLPGKRLTPRQKLTTEAILDAGGVVYVIRDADDIAYMLNDLTFRSSVLGGFLRDTLWP